MQNKNNKKVSNHKVSAPTSFTIETENKLFQFKDYPHKKKTLFYLLFRTTDESSIQ